MPRFALQLLLLLTTSTTITITVHAYSFAPQHQIRVHSSSPLLTFSSRSPSQLNLFGGSKKGESEHDESENNGSSSSSSRLCGIRRGGIVKKDVKKLQKGFDGDGIKFKSGNTEDRHTWKNKKKNYPGAEKRPAFLKSTIYRFRGLKQKVRYLFFRNTVYVLECEGNKYYVGSTSNRKQRYREHFERVRGGSKWTRMHKPIRVVAEYKRIPSKYLMGMESQKTAETMIEHGVNNVRGGSYCFARNFTTADLPSLTAFLGHYNELDYQALSQELRKVLPRPNPTEWSFPPPARNKYGSRNGNINKNKSYDTNTNTKSSSDNKNDDGQITRRPSNRQKLRKLKRKERAASRKANAKCYNCGQTGHWASECPNDSNRKSFENRIKDSPNSTAGIDESQSFDQWLNDSFLDSPSSKPSIAVAESTASIKGSPNTDEDEAFEDSLDQFFDSDDASSSKLPRSVSVSTTSDGDIGGVNEANDTEN